MKPVTLWYRHRAGHDFQGIWRHNHLQDGHLNQVRPLGHPDWKSGRWKANHLFHDPVSNHLVFRAHCCFQTEGNGGRFSVVTGIFDNDHEGKTGVGTIYWLEIRQADLMVQRYEYSICEVLNGSFDPDAIKKEFV